MMAQNTILNRYLGNPKRTTTFEKIAVNLVVKRNIFCLLFVIKMNYMWIMLNEDLQIFRNIDPVYSSTLFVLGLCIIAICKM